MDNIEMLSMMDLLKDGLVTGFSFKPTTIELVSANDPYTETVTEGYSLTVDWQ